MTRLEEIEAKAARLRAFMSERGLEAVALNTQANFAWVTAGGDSHVGLSSEGGVATVVITPESRHVIASAIEAPRMAEEEAVGDLGFELHEHPWPEDAVASIVAGLVGGPVAADHGLAGAEDLSDELARLRWSLLPPEVERYRIVGGECARILEQVACDIEPGMREREAAGMIQGRAFAAGLLPNVCLVAADERCRRYRHPVPTDRPIEKLLMLVIGARRWGLAVSATRIVHFGPLPGDLVRRHEAVCAVDASFILGSHPGASAGDVFRAACETYAEHGYGDEWKLHHQGGATGYAARDYKASPGCDEVVLENQAFAWNPSIAGTKSEDTTLATSDGSEVLSTSTDEWPVLQARWGQGTIARPAILER